MTGEKGGDYFDKDGTCIINSKENAEVLDFMLSMLEDGTAVTTPGGGFHTEEYYGFMAQEGAASMLECLWYMGRFTDYMPELKGKSKWQHRLYGMKTANIRFLAEPRQVSQHSAKYQIWQNAFWLKLK